MCTAESPAHPQSPGQGLEGRILEGWMLTCSVLAAHTLAECAFSPLGGLIQRLGNHWGLLHEFQQALSHLLPPLCLLGCFSISLHQCSCEGSSV